MSRGHVSIAYQSRQTWGPAAVLDNASTPPADDVSAAIHARYARIAAVRVGIRFAGDPNGLAEVTAALGLAVAS